MVAGEYGKHPNNSWMSSADYEENGPEFMHRLVDKFYDCTHQSVY